MKAFFVFAVFVCVTFPGFSQNASSDRFKALSDSMGRTISSTTSKLETYNDMVLDNGNIRNYSSYNQKFEVLKQALGESERRLDLLIRTNDRISVIKEERDNYEKLSKELESLKSDYDNWLKNVK